MLQRLYHDAPLILGADLPPAMYDVRRVRWTLRLSPEGRLEGFLPLGGPDDQRGLPRLVPYLRRTTGIHPILLADSPAYVLGVDRETRPGARGEPRAAEKHAAFKTLVRRCAAETGDPALSAVAAFLARWDPVAGTVPPEMLHSDLLAFDVAGADPAAGAAVQAFWAAATRPAAPEGSRPAVRPRGPTLQCLVTGQAGPTETSLPGTVKRVPGGQASGIALISANEAAYGSFGLERARTSPVGAEAAERFTKALNRLIEDGRTRLTFGGLVHVFWTSEGPDDAWKDLLSRADPAAVRSLLGALRTGGPYTDRDAAAFHAAALSANGSRAVVRDFHSTTVGLAHGCLARWFAAQEIVAPDGDGTLFFPPALLNAGLCRDPRCDAGPQTAEALLHAAVRGGPLPRNLLACAVLRCRTERRVIPARAALIRAVLVGMRPGSGAGAGDLIGLDARLTNPPYLCGRLLNQLEVIQRAALGRGASGLADRHFGAAATAPATVLGLLLAGARRGHPPRIRRRDIVAHNALQSRLGKIVASLGSLPASLTVEQQALFALAFYHQRAADRRDVLAALERKRRGEATAADKVLAAGETPATDPTEEN